MDFLSFGIAGAGRRIDASTLDSQLISFEIEQIYGESPSPRIRPDPRSSRNRGGIAYRHRICRIGSFGRDGHPLCRITAPGRPDPLVRQAVADLYSYLEKVTGADFGTGAGPGRIHLLATVPADAPAGLSENPDACWIEAKGSTIRIAGGSPLGLVYGIYRFLENYVGIRWFLPAPDGEFVPRRRELSVPEKSEFSRPAFPMRWVGAGLWGLRNGSNRPGIAQSIAAGHHYGFHSSVGWSNQPGLAEGLAGPIPERSGFRMEPGIYHTQDHFLPIERYFPTNPEYFALVDGSRKNLKDLTKLCTSNPAVIAVVAANMGRFIDATPGTDIISLSPMDGLGFCECPPCASQDEAGVGRDQLFTRRMVLFYNAVTQKLRETHPKAKVAVGAYSRYTVPPVDTSLRLLPEMYTILCHYSPACLAHPINDPACPANRKYNALISTWRARSSGLLFYEYYWKQNWLGLPWPIMHTIAADIPYFHQQGVIGLHTQYSDSNAYSNGLNYYIAAKLLWNPAADVPALVRDFCEKYYGTAATQMGKYLDRLERRMAAAKSDIPGEAATNALKVFDLAFVDELDALLREAQGAVFPGSVVSRRIARHQIHLRYSRILLEGFQLRQQGEATRQIEKYEEALAFVRDHAADLDGILSPIDAGDFIHTRIDRMRKPSAPAVPGQRNPQ